MSTSKIFSGYIPELTNEILQHCQDDFSTLHSCILVNRLWCRLAIPLLWENPFSIPTENYRFIEFYLYKLNEEDKTKLRDCGINSELLPSNTLFNYPSFIKCLNTQKMGHSIDKWVATVSTKSYLTTSYFTRSIFRSLLNILIGGSVKFHTLSIFIGFDVHLNDICELILQNPNLFHNIK